MTANFEPSTYPGRRPTGPALVWNGDVHHLDLTGPTPTVADLDAPVLRVTPRYAIAYGSNASPDRLIDKELDRRGSLLLHASAWGWATAWEARRSTATGSVPLTLVPAPGKRLDTWVLGVHPADLDRLDASEFRGRNYLLGVIGEVAVAARWRIPRAVAFGPGPSTRVLVDAHGDPLTLPPGSQRHAAGLLDRGGASCPVEPLPETVRGAWPGTHLEPLDLFVYGTLRPGAERWSAVADLVDVVGEVRTGGRVWATPMGWPAAVFSDDVPAVVHGTLVRPRDAEAGAELYRRGDEIEGEGEWFVRVAVQVRDDDGRGGWAAAYGWHPDHGEPPGVPVPDGRWGRHGA